MVDKKTKIVLRNRKTGRFASKKDIGSPDVYHDWVEIKKEEA